MTSRLSVEKRRGALRAALCALHARAGVRLVPGPAETYRPAALEAMACGTQAARRRHARVRSASAGKRPRRRSSHPTTHGPRAAAPGCQRRRTGTNLTGVPGGACAAAGRSAARTTAITG